MGRRKGVHVRGQCGFTLFEAVLTLAIASIGILAVALGLLTSVRADNGANEQQRLNLALTTFTESLGYRGCTATYTSPTRPGDVPAPTTETHGSSPTLAALFVEDALDKPQLVQWTERGYTFAVTKVEYWDPTTADPESGTDSFVEQCPTGQRWPAVRLSVWACKGDDGDGGSGQCESNEIAEAQVVKRTRNGIGDVD